jgi:hypothetical protein
MIEKSVDFPEPLGPTSPILSARWIETVTSENNVRVPQDLEMFESIIIRTIGAAPNPLLTHPGDAAQRPRYLPRRAARAKQDRAPAGLIGMSLRTMTL